MNWRIFLLLIVLINAACAEEPLAGTKLLDPPLSQEARSAAMVAGVGQWLKGAAARATTERHERWAAAAQGGEWEKFAAEKRRALAAVLGLEEKPARPLPPLEKLEGGWVRWSVYDDVQGEGLLMEPAGRPRAIVIVVPDADESPEQCVLAQRIAQTGCQVLVPLLVSRSDEFSGKQAVRFTNQPHREWIYRQAFEMGRTLIGYEVQKILAALDVLTAGRAGDSQPPVYLAGHGEGGLIALRAAALEPRFQGLLLSGSFEPHEAYFQEPIDRDLFGAWKDFGDAELAALVAPRPVVVEVEAAPPHRALPAPREGRTGAAPGLLTTPTAAAVKAEFSVAHLVSPTPNRLAMSDGTSVFPELGAVDRPPLPLLPRLDQPPPEMVAERQRRTVLELEQHTQHLVFAAERARNAQVWAKAGTPEWPAARAALQERLWASIGQLPADRLPPSPRTRRIQETPKWTAYEVMLDVLPDFSAWGWLLVPKDLQPGERRPVVVCQHGLEGLPGDTVTQDPKDKAFGYYKGFAAQLADEGYITYAPHNLYRGQDAFRVLQRQANPLGLSLFSFIIAQHEVTTAWLAGLPFVNPQKIGFYGLSYGGKTAMRVPALVDRYALSICSGDFNEWIRKNVNLEESLSYMFTGEYEMPEWNLAWNANYAEMAMLIAPRPFMVERGHSDGVGLDEWVGYEYAKVQRGYLRLGVPEKAAIEWFDGPHTINGKGTFEFLRRHLGPAKR